MEGVMSGFVLTWVVSMAVWLLLTVGSGGAHGLWSGAELGWGAAVATVVAAATGKTYAGASSWKGVSPLRMIQMAVYAAGPFFLEMGKANFEVAWRVLTGNIRPGIVQVKSGMTSEGQVVALANSITLTPGTLTVDLREKGDGSVPDELFVHLLAVPEGMEKRGRIAARELFGRFDCPAWIRRMVP